MNDEAETTVPDGSESMTLSHVPQCVFVDFGTKAWTLPGTPGPGIYPVFRTERTWYLDGYRKQKAALAIKRQQIPLAPALACTVHAAQGQSLKAVIADLALGTGVSSIASYVAITRVTRREGLLIFRPFQLEPFQKGLAEGTALLLQKLRGEEIDWAAVEAKHIPKKHWYMRGGSE